MPAEKWLDYPKAGHEGYAAGDKDAEIKNLKGALRFSIMFTIIIFVAALVECTQ